MSLHRIEAQPTAISGIIAVTARSARGFARNHGMTPGGYARNFVQDRGTRRGG
jgi:hypothetical protein